MDKQGWISRREVAKLLGVGGAAIAAGLPSRVMAQATKTALVIGIDISDTITLDPARQAYYSSPMTLQAAYDALVTMEPGEYINVDADARDQMGAHAGRQGLALHASARASSSRAATRCRPRT